MMTASWRKLSADFKTHKLQFFLIWSVLTLSAMLLTVSLLVMGSSDQPWDRTFEATNGPHVWVVSHQYDLDFTPITSDPAVSQSSGVILSLSDNPLVLGDQKIPIFLYAMDQLPQVAHPLLAEGRWLDPANPDEIVLDFSLARFYDFRVGDEAVILGVEAARNLRVVGLAITVHWFPYNEVTKDVSPGVAYISEATLTELQPDPASWYSVVGLRLREPEKSKAFVEKVYEAFPGKLRSVIEWQFVKQNAALANTLNAMFMGLFSVLGLAAVGMIIFNTIGGQVLSQYREIGLFKAVGFKPGQVTRIFLFEHLLIGLIAAVVGILMGLAVAPGFVSTLAENLNTTPPDIFAPGPLLAVLILVEMAVAQGGRIDTVQAITIGYCSRPNRVSHLARFAGWLHLPAIIVLGVKDIFSRPLRAVLAITSLFLTVFIAITAIGAQTTASYLAENRVYFNGTSADLKVTRNFVPAAIIQEEILTNPEVVDSYQELVLYGNAPGHSDQPIALRLLDGNYKDFFFDIKEGRMIAAPGEAVFGYAVLDLIDAQVGDTVEILVEGSPMKLTIVGRHIESNMTNHVIITSLETYQEQVDALVQSLTYYLRLKDYVQAENLRTEWLEQSQGLIDVSVIEDQPQASMTQLVNLIVSLAALLMIVAGANLMSTSLLSIQERVRDFGILKTLGFTPSQISGSVVVGSIVMALIALVLGITLGLWLVVVFVQQVGIAIGAGPDFYVIDWGGISLLLPILVLLAAISSVLPATRAARLEVIEALRYE
jgi:putative ABC transport system permease protein